MAQAALRPGSVLRRRPGRAQPAPVTGPVVLTQNRIYILPSRMGALYCLTLILMLLGSINYNLGLGYVLTFLLAGLGVVSMLHAWRNLAGLAVTAGRTEPVFVGEHARFRLTVSNPTDSPRYGIGTRRGNENANFTNVPPRDQGECFVELVARQRGWLDPGRIEVATSYPVGLFRAWSHVRFDWRTLVYPKPEAGHPPLPPSLPSSGHGLSTAAGEDDFSGLRDYRPGDPPRRMAWKVLARRGTPAVKEFSDGQGAADVWLDWSACPREFDAEQRVARLTAWVLTASSRHLRYGLRLPGVQVGADTGPAHREACLRALALHGDPAP
jgi:uncharacterized protein (DUF58 family)